VTERLVLSSWINDRAFRLGWQPEPDLFYSRPHGLIAEVFRDVFPVERWNEAFTLAELEKRDQLRNIGSRERVIEWLTRPTLGDPHAAVRELRELKAIRELGKSLQRLVVDIGAGAKLHELQSDLRGATEASVTAVGVPVLTAPDLMDLAMKHLQSEGEISYCTTGWAAIDKATGGLRQRKVWIFGAETHWGKTAWLVMVLDENIQREKRVLVVTVEDDAELWAWRIACRRSKVNFTRFRDRRLHDTEWSAITDHQQQIRKSKNLWLLDASAGIPVEVLAGQIHALCLAYSIDLVVFDYAQAAISERDMSRVDMVRHIGRTVTGAIKGSGAAGVITSQLTTEVGKRMTKLNIRDCRDLANAAEGIILGEWVKSSTDGIYREVKVEKGKLGGTGSKAEAEWNPESASFISDVPKQLDLGYSDEEDEEDPF
jgi:replicative DNA helicase